jgi:hypothetical protein
MRREGRRQCGGEGEREQRAARRRHEFRLEGAAS